MYYKITATKKALTIIIAIVLIFALIPVAKYLHEQYLIHKARQTYNIMRGAFVRVNLSNNLKWTDETMDTNVFANSFVRELPVRKTCGYNPRNSACFPKKINFQRPLPGTEDVTSIILGDYYKVKLKNGVGIAFKILSPDCSLVRGRCGTIFIDINGSKKGPNKFGVDLFDFSINKDEIKTYPMSATHVNRCLAGTGQGCTEYLLKYKTFNYRKYAKEAVAVK